ncbi:MAG: hypothetical protein RLW62_15235 [Gammaproteobacteria bacterium]
MRTLFLAAALLVSSSAHSATVTIVNGDFESTTPLPFGQPSIGPWGMDNIPGWRATVPRNSGIWRQGTAPTLAPLPGSTQTAWLGISSGSTAAIEQDLVAAIEAATRYVLSVQVGDRSDTPLGSPDGTPGNATGGSAALLSTSGELLAEQVFDGLFVQNGWRELLLDFTPTADDIGKQLRVRLQSDGIQVNFDNVTLTATSVPVPAAGILLASALGLPVLRRRRRASP